jgi:hypothetical protein
MATQTFELVSPFLTIYAPSKKWAGDSSLLLGQTSNRLVTGELLSYTGANGVQRPSVVIGNNVTAADNAFGLSVFAAPYFSETGRGDIVTGGNVPVLQFGPFEADTMLFMRAGDDATDATGNGAGSLAAGPDALLEVIGAPVVAAAVRNPLTGNFNSSDYVIGIAPADKVSNPGAIIGRISRVIGSGASAKIRVMFGVN